MHGGIGKQHIDVLKVMDKKEQSLVSFEIEFIEASQIVLVDSLQRVQFSDINAAMKIHNKHQPTLDGIKLNGFSDNSGLV